MRNCYTFEQLFFNSSVRPLFILRLEFIVEIPDMVEDIAQGQEIDITKRPHNCCN